MYRSPDYFDFHYKITKFFVLIPPDNPKLNFLYRVLSPVHLLLISLSVLMETAMLFLRSSSISFSSFVLTLGINMLHGMAVNRLVKWIFIKSDYDKILGKLRQISSNLYNFDYESKGDEIRKYHTRVLQQTYTQCKILLMAFLAYVHLNIIVSYSVNSISRTEERWNPILNKTSVYRDYPYELWYPFDTSISDGYYWIGLLYQPYAFLFLMCGFFCIDVLCVNTVIHLTAFIKVLGHAFACLDSNVDPTLTEAQVLQLKETRLIKCIKQLKEIFECGGMLNELFSSQLLVQELCMSGVVCCSIYRGTSGEAQMVEISYVCTMGMVAAMQMFTLSWFNQCFTAEVLELSHPIYALDWLNYNKKMRKTLLFLLKRVQTPFYFTMGLGFPLDIHVFLTMIKTSYSFYALLTNTGLNT